MTPQPWPRVAPQQLAARRLALTTAASLGDGPDWPDLVEAGRALNSALSPAARRWLAAAAALALDDAARLDLIAALLSDHAPSDLRDVVAAELGIRDELDDFAIFGEDVAATWPPAWRTGCLILLWPMVPRATRLQLSLSEIEAAA